MALDGLLDLFAHRFLCFSFISFCFSYSYVRRIGQLLAHNKIVIDWLIEVSKSIYKARLKGHGISRSVPLNKENVLATVWNGGMTIPSEGR